MASQCSDHTSAISVQYVGYKAGVCLLHVKHMAEPVAGSPFWVEMHPGRVDASLCVVQGIQTNGEHPRPGLWTSFRVVTFDELRNPCDFGGERLAVHGTSSPYVGQPSFQLVDLNNGAYTGTKPTRAVSNFFSLHGFDYKRNAGRRNGSFQP